MRISVVIPHLNQPDLLARCLASLQAGARRPDEVFVVDNGSHRPPAEVCAAHPGVRLLEERTPGPGPARNRGVAASTGEILAFIDADCFAAPDWLAAIAAEMADPAAEILGGDVHIAVAEPGRLTMLEAYESEFAYRMDHYIAREGFTGTGNLAVRRAVFEAVGPFGGLSVAEDRDWGQRATARGHRIRHVPGMRVYHPARQDFQGVFEKWDRHIAHDFVAAAARPGGRARFLAKTLVMGVSPLGEIPRIATSRRLSGAGPRLQAFLALTRIRLHRARRMAWLLLGGDAQQLARRWNRAK